MVFYDYDSNAILAKTIKNNQASTIRDAFIKIHNILKSRCSNSKFYIIDNKCSSNFKKAMQKQTKDFQLSPPHMLRQNASDHVIRTCKNHFVSGIATTDPYLPIKKWDQLLPQCLTTLNLLHNSRANPALSAHAYLFGL